MLRAESKTAPKSETEERPEDYIQLQPQANDVAHVYETGTTDMVCLFYNIEIEAIYYIVPDVKIADTRGLDMFGYQFDTTISISLEYNQKRTIKRNYVRWQHHFRQIFVQLLRPEMET